MSDPRPFGILPDDEYGWASLQPGSALFKKALSLSRESQAVLECQLRGASMEPAIPAGARLRIMCLAPRLLSTGQVIAFVAGDGVCVHRIVYRGRWGHARDYLITRGDNCQIPDVPVHTDRVLGTVTEFAHVGPWKPPPRARPVGPVRLLVSLILAGILEINLQLAEWLTQKLWRAAATFNLARARFLLPGRRRNRSMSAPWDSPEMQLLAACARARSDDGSAAAVRAIMERGALDWRSLLVRAEFHGMLPLLYLHLSRTDLQVPAETMHHLRSSARHLMQRSLFMTGHLLKVVRLLQEHGIAVIPIKGPVLAVRAYGDAGLRQHADLDILVGRDDIRRVKEVLATVGYQPEIARDAKSEEIHLNSDKDLALFLESGIYLEVHHALTPPFSLATMDMDALQRRTTEMSFLGTKVRALSAEDEVLYLCLNGAAHCWSRLEYVCTLAEMVKQNPHLDWIGMIRHARQYGSVRALYLGLHLGHELLGAPLPPDLASRLDRCGSTRRLAACVRRRLNRTPPWSSNWENVWFTLSIQDGVGRWLASALRFATIPTGADAAAFSLPRPLHFLYRVLRPFHLLYRYTRQRLLQGRKALSERPTETPSWAQR